MSTPQYQPGSAIATMGDLAWVCGSVEYPFLYVGRQRMSCAEFEKKTFGQVMALLVDGRLRTAIPKTKSTKKPKAHEHKSKHRTSTHGRHFGR
jgi:hypothetical protein